MACITLFAPPMTMATTQFTRKADQEFHTPNRSERNFQRRIPRMNWVVVTDNTGVTRLRMRWTATQS